LKTQPWAATGHWSRESSVPPRNKIKFVHYHEVEMKKNNQKEKTIQNQEEKRNKYNHPIDCIYLPLYPFLSFIFFNSFSIGFRN